VRHALNYPSGPLAIMALQMDNITVTERAAHRIGEILRREPAGTMLRVSVEGGGCSGFQYKFDMESAQAADDLVIQRDGATVLIDQTSVGYLAGSEIDFVDDLIGASFRINNPQATASCGCGTSFSI
jgi:iron-sulfur cluster assembly accessory protein